MPVVTFTQRQSQSQPLPKADPTFLMMAAAELHEAGRLIQVADKDNSLGLAQDAMSDEEYDNTWHHSEARKGRSDAQMKSLYPDLEAYRLSKDSDLISYHKKPAPKLGDLVS